MVRNQAGAKSVGEVGVVGNQAGAQSVGVAGVVGDQAGAQSMGIAWVVGDQAVSVSLGVAGVVGDKEKNEEDEAYLIQEPQEPQDCPFKLAPVTRAVVETAAH